MLLGATEQPPTGLQAAAAAAAEHPRQQQQQQQSPHYEATAAGGNDDPEALPCLDDEEDEAALQPMSSFHPLFQQPQPQQEGGGGGLADNGAGGSSNPSHGGGGRMQLDVHIAYHPTYRVPLLLFRARPAAGSCVTRDVTAGVTGSAAPLSHDALLSLLAAPLRRHADSSIPGWAYVTQVTHPVLIHLWASLHPCRTAELMRLMLASDSEREGGAAAAATGGGGGGISGAATAAAAAAVAELELAGRTSPGEAASKQNALLRYMVGWFSIVGRTIGLQIPSAAYL